MPRYRLNDRHDAVIAFNALCAYADELGISVHFDRYTAEMVYRGVAYEMRDVEDNEYEVADFPPITEVKFVRDTD